MQAGNRHRLLKEFSGKPERSKKHHFCRDLHPPVILKHAFFASRGPLHLAPTTAAAGKLQRSFATAQDDIESAMPKRRPVGVECGLCGNKKEGARVNRTWTRFFPLFFLLALPSTAQTTGASPAPGIDSICLCEILIGTPQPNDPAQSIGAQHKAEGAREAILQGAKFADVARKMSDGPSATYGGAVGRFKRGQLAKEIEDKVFAMKIGEVTDVIRTKQGFAILQVWDCGEVAKALGESRPVEVLSDTKGVDFGPYVQRVRQDIQTNWYRQIPDPIVEKKGKVIIELSIMKDGSVANMRFVETSGNELLDRAAWGGVTKSSPFPPLPTEFAGPYLLLRLRFHYNFDKNELE